jgi:hypothetical protein
MGGTVAVAASGSSSTARAHFFVLPMYAVRHDVSVGIVYIAGSTAEILRDYRGFAEQMYV